MRQLFSRVWCLHRQASRTFQRALPSVPSSPTASLLLSSHQRRCKHDDNSDEPENQLLPQASKLAEARRLLPNRYQVFEDKDTEIIFDDSVDLDVILNQKQKRRPKRTHQDDLKQQVGQLRGQRGVFDIEELIALLREENMVDIATIKVPPELKYCEFMVLCTAASPKHIKRFAETLNQLYKIKKHPSDAFLNLNDASKDWRLIDLQNIILNVFLDETRRYYDIECLWTVGEAFDEKVQRPEGSHTSGSVVEDILQRHLSFLESQAAAKNNSNSGSDLTGNSS